MRNIGRQLMVPAPLARRLKALSERADMTLARVVWLALEAGGISAVERDYPAAPDTPTDASDGGDGNMVPINISVPPPLANRVRAVARTAGMRESEAYRVAIEGGGVRALETLHQLTTVNA
jgi:hypothetical protein